MLPSAVVKAYNDQQSGMTIEQRQQIDGDLRDGVVSLPRAARHQPWRPMTTGENATRALGLGTRAVIEGVGDIAGMVMNPLNTLLNATGVPQKVAGAPLPLANDPGVNIPDMMGLPRPQFDNERMLSAIERGATTGLATFGGASLASKAPGAIGTVGRALSAAPVTDVVASGISAGSAEAARQSGFGPIGQFVAGVAGGGIGIGTSLAAERAVSQFGRRAAADLPASTPRDVVINLTGELTEEGQELVARHGFTPEEIKQAYTDAQPARHEAAVSTAGRDVEAPTVPPAAAAGREVADTTSSSSQSVVRRYDGVDYPVEVVGPEQADAAGRIHVQVRGAGTGEVGFVPKDELFPAPSAPPANTPPEPIAPTPSDAASPPSLGTQRTAADRTREAEALGIPLTRGQAMQDFAVQDTEQTLRAQASGDGDKARTFLVDQADKIKTATTKFREAFGPVDATRTERGQLVKDAVRELRDQGKAGVSALYREAESMGGGGLALDHSNIVDAAKRVLVEADVPDGVKNVVRQEMARYGMLGKDAVTAEDGLTTVKLTDGRRVQFYGDPEPLTVGNAEAFRKAISAQYMVDGPRKLSQGIKGAIDEAVEGAIESAARNGVDGPVGAKLQEARRAVVVQKQTFAAKDIVQKLIDWRKGTRTDELLPDHAIREVLSGDLTNLRKMKAVLLSDPTGKSKAAWQGVQAEAIGSIFDKAYVANANLGGGSIGTISGAKLNSEIIRFGVPKLKVLLSEQDFDRLMSLRRVIGEATVPISGTTNPSGSAFKLMRFLGPMASKFAGIPLAGPVLDVASGLVKQAKATAEAQRTLRGMTQYSGEAAARDVATSASKATPKVADDADKAVNGLVNELVETSRAGRLTSMLLSAHGEGRPSSDAP
jgi:hypothetical protein